MTPIRVARCPMADPRRMPFARPDIGRHQARLRASPKIRPQDRPRVVPSRPRIPSPVAPARPVPRASAVPVNFMHEIRHAGRRSRSGPRRKRHRRGTVHRRANRESSREDGTGSDGLAHACLLECPLGRGFCRRPPMRGHERHLSPLPWRVHVTILHLAMKDHRVGGKLQGPLHPLFTARNRASSTLPWLPN